MVGTEDGARRPWTAAAVRFALLLAFWLVLSQGAPADFAAGIAAAMFAAWISLKLHPVGLSRPSLLALGSFALRFLRQSVVAGFDVAWRALDPRLPLNTGFVIYRSRLPQEHARSAYCTLASLLPGTLPVDREQSGALLIHCLDTEQPVATQLANDEALFARAWGVSRHG